MCTALEQAFIVAVTTAEGVRQTSKAAAFTTYGFVAANYATYVAALVAADVAFLASVNTAATTAGITPIAVESGPVGGNWATILA